MLNSLKHSIKEFIYRIVPPPPAVPANSVGTVYFGQAGEDAVIDFLFKGRKINNPSYLELGAYSPDKSNNTYKFYLRNSKGVVVEADPELIAKLKAKRPNDTILNIGVGISEEKEADFYVFNVKGLSTLNKEEAEYREKNGSYKIEKIIKVELKSINAIIKENFETYPLFLSIDIEGLDLAVLQTLDFNKYPIPVICAETCTYSENHIKPKDDLIFKFMESKGYMVYADTYINTFFVNKEWFFSE
ncbi:MAG: FkbM family methyltransferase [Chitinophagales bacterium]